MTANQKAQVDSLLRMGIPITVKREGNMGTGDIIFSIILGRPASKGICLSYDIEGTGGSKIEAMSIPANSLYIMVQGILRRLFSEKGELLIIQGIPHKIVHKSVYLYNLSSIGYFTSNITFSYGFLVMVKQRIDPEHPYYIDWEALCEGGDINFNPTHGYNTLVDILPLEALTNLYTPEQVLLFNEDKYEEGYFILFTCGPDLLCAVPWSKHQDYNVYIVTQLK